MRFPGVWAWAWSAGFPGFGAAGWEEGTIFRRRLGSDDARRIGGDFVRGQGSEAVGEAARAPSEAVVRDERR